MWFCSEFCRNGSFLNFVTASFLLGLKICLVVSENTISSYSDTDDFPHSSHVLFKSTPSSSLYEQSIQLIPSIRESDSEIFTLQANNDNLRSATQKLNTVNTHSILETSISTAEIQTSPVLLFSSDTVFIKNTSMHLLTWSSLSQSNLICTSVVTITTLCSPSRDLSSSVFMLKSSSLIDFSSIGSSAATVIPSSSIYSDIIDSSSAVLPDFSTSIISTPYEELNISSAFIPATVSMIDVTSATSLIVQSAAVLTPAERFTTCDQVAANFSEALNNYSSCVLLNLKPMEVCYKCFKEYRILNEHHIHVYTKCKKDLIIDYNHKYQVVSQMFDIQKKTWDSLECDKCYDHDTDPPKPTKEFIKFQSMYQNTMDCFQNYSFPSVKNSTNRTESNVCLGCKDIYSKLQLTFKFREDSEEEYETNWCADINVAVNGTRHKWSMEYKCGVKERDLVSIIALTCFFCFLPIVFYVGAKLHSDVKERKSNRYYESE